MRLYLQRYWWSNNPAIWLDKRHNWPHLTKSGTLRWYLPLVSIFIQKNKDHLILSTDTHAHQRILQSDYTKGTSGHPQPKQAVSHPALPWWSSPYKKCKRWIDSFQRYWWSKNTAIRLAESILGHNWRTRFFSGMGFLQNHEGHCHTQFWG